MKLLKNMCIRFGRLYFKITPLFENVVLCNVLHLYCATVRVYYCVNFWNWFSIRTSGTRTHLPISCDVGEYWSIRLQCRNFYLLRSRGINTYDTWRQRITVLGANKIVPLFYFLLLHTYSDNNTRERAEENSNKKKANKTLLWHMFCMTRGHTVGGSYILQLLPSRGVVYFFFFLSTAAPLPSCHPRSFVHNSIWINTYMMYNICMCSWKFPF